MMCFIDPDSTQGKNIMFRLLRRIPEMSFKVKKDQINRIFKINLFRLKLTNYWVAKKEDLEKKSGEAIISSMQPKK